MIPNTLPQGLVENPRLDSWIGFEEPGRVRVATGKVELGQGILTVVVQLAADELDVAPERIALVSGDTARSPNEGMTSGSLSVQNSGGSVRLAAAEVRALMLDAASIRLGCDRSSLAVVDGRIVRDGVETALDYWSLAPALDLARAATGAAPTKAAASRRVIGTSMPRVDLPAKVVPPVVSPVVPPVVPPVDAAARKPVFIHDMTASDMLHARILRQPWPGAELATSDADIATHATGVQIVRVNDFLAVVADSERAATIAAERLARHTTWRNGRPLPDACSTSGWVATAPAESRTYQRGEPVSETSARQFTQRYNKPFIAHASIGPSCALARDDTNTLTVWTHSQGVEPLRHALARGMKRDPASIHVVHIPGAGCYGHNGADDVAADAAVIAAAMPGRTIRVQFTRDDELSTTPLGPAMQVKLNATLDDTGNPIAWTTDIWSTPHAQRPGANGGVNLLAFAAMPDPPATPFPEELPEAAGGSGARNAWLLYDVPRQTIHNHIVATSGPRTSSMRGLGAFANVFAIECFMDELAAAAGVDPIQYRLRLVSDPRAKAVIERVSEMASWRGPLGKADGRGRGFAWSRYKNRAGYCAIIVDVVVDEAVRIERVWCAADAGLAVNPDGVTNQVEGGIIQATSWALKEEVRFADGRNALRGWDDYPILKFSDVPPIEIDLVQHENAPMLGMGEVSQGPTGAAIGNAVADALGVRIRDLPLSRDRIIAALA